MKNQIIFQIKVGVREGVDPEQAASVLATLIDCGLADAADTVDQGEGDLQHAMLATDMDISSPEVVDTIKPQGEIANAELPRWRVLFERATEGMLRTTQEFFAIDEDAARTIASQANPECRVLQVQALPAKELAQIRLTMDVSYDLNGENAVEMSGRLQRMCEHAINEGLLTGESDAQVEKYSIRTKVL